MTSAPTTADSGDVWVDTSGSQNVTKVYSGGAWQLAGTVGATFSAGQPGTVAGQITSVNASTYIANAAIGAAQIGSLALVGTSNFSVKSSASTSVARMEMDSRSIKVYDASGIKRVQIGNLLA